MWNTGRRVEIREIRFAHDFADALDVKFGKTYHL